MNINKSNIEKYKLARKLRISGQTVLEIKTELNIGMNTVRRWTSDIKTTHRRYKTKNINHEYFSKESLKKHPERFVIIGFIAADGCIYKNRLCFNISSKDESVLNIINKEICKGDRTISYIKKTNSCQMYIPSKQIAEDLKEFNIVPRKTQHYELPNIEDKKSMAYFLRGYVYGDGCISGEDGGQVCLIMGSKIFTKQLQIYLHENHIINHSGVYPAKNKQYLNIHIKNREAEKFTKYIFFNNKMNLLPRKHKIVEGVVHQSLWREEDIKQLNEMRVKDFIEETGRALYSCLMKKFPNGGKRLKWDNKQLKMLKEQKYEELHKLGRSGNSMMSKIKNL